MIMDPVAKAAGSRLLFPVQPEPHETLLGFVVRCLGRNHLGAPVNFMRSVGLDIGVKGDLLSRLQTELPGIAQALSMPLEALAGLWGAEPVSESGKRRLGGVFLRPALVEQAKLRVPPSIGAESSDDARWMIRPIGFCSTRWELLVDRCPGRWCGKVLTWPRADSLHLCRHCGTPVSAAPRLRIPARHRPLLQWMMSLFSDDVTLREAAMRRVPAHFRVTSETEVFELLYAFRHASMLLAGAREDMPGSPDDDQVTHWVAAARFLLEYPRSRWDVLQTSKVGEVSALHGALKRVARNSRVPIVWSELEQIIAEELHPPRHLLQIESARVTKLTARGAADRLGVPTAAVMKLVQAERLLPYRTAGHDRKHRYFIEEDVEHLRHRLQERRSWHWFKRQTNIPTIAIEQLIALGHMKECGDEDVTTLYGKRNFDFRTIEHLLREFRNWPVLTSQGIIPLEQVFMGVGAREKPWGPVLGAALNRTLPGCIANVGTYNEPSYGVTKLVATELIMGGSKAMPWFNFNQEDYGPLARDWYSPGEVGSYLNCSAVDVSFLREQGHLLPRADEHNRRYDRAEVHEFALKWMNTREAAARLGVSPRDVWRVLESYLLEAPLGRGFCERDELEPIVDLEVEARRRESIYRERPFRVAGIEEAP